MAAAGSVDYTNPTGGPVRRAVASWTSDSSGNANPAAADWNLNGTILRAEFDPGSPAPTDNYGVTLLDEYGFDVLGGGAAANRDTANTESFVPVIGGGDALTKFPVVVSGLHQLNVSGAGNAKSGRVILYLR
jgi:hypothetical protein